MGRACGRACGKPTRPAKTEELKSDSAVTPGPYANLLVQQVGTLLNIPSCEKYGNFVVQGLVKHGNDLDKDAAA